MVDVMRLVFLFPLALGLAAGAISQQLADEIAYLTGAFAVLNLLLSLILAPWQVQILLLIAAFFIVRYLWLKAETRHEELEALTPADRKVSRQYRGVSYDDHSDHSVAMDLGQNPKVARQYRGVSYEGPRTAPSPEAPILQTKPLLFSRLAIKYRGATLMAASAPSPGTHSESP